MAWAGRSPRSEQLMAEEDEDKDAEGSRRDAEPQKGRGKGKSKGRSASDVFAPEGPGVDVPTGGMIDRFFCCTSLVLTCVMHIDLD